MPKPSFPLGDKIRDNIVAWRRKVLYIPYLNWRNTTTGATNQPVTGAPFGGVALTTTGATEYQGGFVLPRDVDPTHEVGFRIFGSAATLLTDLSSVTYVVLAQFAALHGAAISSTAAGALDTVIGATSITAGGGMRHLSNRGIKNAGFLTRSQIWNGAVMQWSMALTACDATISSNAIVVHALLFDYMPMRTTQPGDQDADAWVSNGVY